MTGSNKWRRPLAVLASVATLATMGMVAGTANAADAPQTKAKVNFIINNATVKTIDGVRTGTSLADKMHTYNAGSFALPKDTVFTGWDTDFSQQVYGDKDVKGETKAPNAAVKVVFSGVSAGDFEWPDGTTGTTYYANAGSTLGVRVPRDVKDGRVVLKWKVSDGSNAATYTEDLSKVDTTNLAGKTLTITPEETATAYTLTVKANDGGYLTGAYADGDDKDDYTVDVANGQTVTLPSTWTNYEGHNDKPASLKDGKVEYKLGGAFTGGNGNTTLVPSASASDVYDVLFQDANGALLYTGHATKDAEASEQGATLPADQRKAISDIKIDGFVVKGWEPVYGAADVHWQGDTAKPTYFSNDDLDNVYFTGPVTFRAVQGGTTGTVKVTFRDATYTGQNKAVVVDAQGGEYLSADKFPTFTRKGYVFSKWVLSDGNGNPTDVDSATSGVQTLEFDTNALIGDGYWANNFTVVAVWEKVDSNVLDAALDYVPVDDAHAKLFSPASWSAYKGVQQSVVNEKQQLEYKSSNGKVSDDDAARLVTKLSDAWKDLVFISTDSNFVVPSYRFFNRVNGEHLFTSDKKEIASLKVNNDWTYEGEAFKSLANTKDSLFETLSSFQNLPATYSGAVKDKLASIADPIVVPAYRLFNRENGEHLFTTDANEYNILVSRNWSGENVAFYAPKYSSTKNVYRLFDPAKGQHLFTLDSNEAKILSTKYGWSNEGVVFKAL